jgi:hypothetical protein
MSNGQTELARRLSDFRDQSYKNLTEKLAPFSEFDPIAITSLMISAVTFMVLISTQRGHIADIDLTNDSGWERIETAIRRIYAGLSIALEREDAKTHSIQETQSV